MFVGSGQSRSFRVLGVLAACLFAAAVAAPEMTATATAATRPHVSVYFVLGEQLAPVPRPGTTAQEAVRQLIAGPTRAESLHGYRTYVPASTRVRSVTAANGIVTIDVSEPFVTGTSAESMLARLAELVSTATALQPAKKVQLLVNGARTAGMFPGVSTTGPITLRFLQTPNVSVPVPPQERLPSPDSAVKATQNQLIALGYLVPGDADGRFGPATSDAILAFQKWERLGRTGLLDSRTKARLATATRPLPLSHGGAGKRAEILLDRQVALLINNDKVVRAIAVSSGKPSTPTPPGDYHVYAKIPRWWSVPFREWLPYALPFVGGIAFHQFGDVPTYPASHGCVRQSVSVAPWTYAFANVGMPVKVLARS